MPPDGQCIINLRYSLLDCTCSNIGLITWSKQNLDKIEDPEGTRCSEPKLLAGFSWPRSHSPMGWTHKESLPLSWLVYPVVPSSFGVLAISSKITNDYKSRMGTQKIPTATVLSWKLTVFICDKYFLNFCNILSTCIKTSRKIMKKLELKKTYDLNLENVLITYREIPIQLNGSPVIPVLWLMHL